ncbi:hypothetical protein NQZ68_017734 [Dissostichus eleginoides]|nr:hypothetical protein NQZ68_017734 [Dissostichus eleginoides]
MEIERDERGDMQRRVSLEQKKRGGAGDAPIRRIEQGKRRKHKEAVDLVCPAPGGPGACDTVSSPGAVWDLGQAQALCVSRARAPCTRVLDHPAMSPLLSAGLDARRWHSQTMSASFEAKGLFINRKKADEHN